MFIFWPQKICPRPKREPELFAGSTRPTRTRRRNALMMPQKGRELLSSLPPTSAIISFLFFFFFFIAVAHGKNYLMATTHLEINKRFVEWTNLETSKASIISLLLFCAFFSFPPLLVAINDDAKPSRSIVSSFEEPTIQGCQQPSY